MSSRITVWKRRSRVFALGAALGLSAPACGGGGGTTEPPATTTMAAHAGHNQNGTVGQPVTVPPAVRLTRGGAGVSGVAVTFAVASGGGTVAGANATTDGNGVATVGSWTLGPAAGSQTLTATASGASGGPITFSATAAAGPPQVVAKQAGDNQQFRASNPVPVRPSVRVGDQFDNPVAGVTVQFAVTAGSGVVTGAVQTTDGQGVATVGGWTLGPELGEQRLTATVQAPGAPEPTVFTALALENAIAPAVDTTLAGGLIEVTRFTVAAGRTVTVTGNLVVRSEGNIQVAGTLRGVCVALTLDAEEVLTVTGAVNNSCADDADDPPPLLLIGREEYDVGDDAAITTSGDFEITNDPTLTDDDFPPPLEGAALGSAARSAPGRAASVQAATTDACRIGGTVRHSPERARDGRPGIPRGDDGNPGKRLWISCRGNAIVSRMEVFGQHGGHGGLGTHTINTNNHARGGNGGKGGEVRFRSTGDMTFLGNSAVRTGRGGDGGPAESFPAPQRPGERAPDANATGGTGGPPGLFQVLTQGVITFPGPGHSPAVFTIGDAGDGGSAFAVAVDGLDASTAAPAQPGGHANAQGGTGGSTPDKRLSGTGIVNPGGLLLNGGNAGTGGEAVASAGLGGRGERPTLHGARGGDMIANGGEGGDANLRNQFNAPVGNPGAGGDHHHNGGAGGRGADGCVPPIGPGGNGGRGGNASGGPGEDGTQGGNPSAPRLTGRPALATASSGQGTVSPQTGNGGNAGRGWLAGNRGDPGTNGVPGAVLEGPAFQEGERQNLCFFKPTFTVVSDPAGQEPALGFTGPTANHAAAFLKSGSSFFGSIGLGTTNTVCLVRPIEGPFGNIFCGSMSLSGTSPNMSVGGGGSFGRSTSSGSVSGSVSFTGTIDQVDGLILLLMILTTPAGDLTLEMLAEVLFGDDADFVAGGQAGTGSVARPERPAPRGRLASP